MFNLFELNTLAANVAPVMYYLCAILIEAQFFGGLYNHFILTWGYSGRILVSKSHCIFQNFVASLRVKVHKTSFVYIITHFTAIYFSFYLFTQVKDYTSNSQKNNDVVNNKQYKLIILGLIS